MNDDLKITLEDLPCFWWVVLPVALIIGLLKIIFNLIKRLIK